MGIVEEKKRKYSLFVRACKKLDSVSIVTRRYTQTVNDFNKNIFIAKKNRVGYEYSSFFSEWQLTYRSEL